MGILCLIMINGIIKGRLCNFFFLLYHREDFIILYLSQVNGRKHLVIYNLFTIQIQLHVCNGFFPFFLTLYIHDYIFTPIFTQNSILNWAISNKLDIFLILLSRRKIYSENINWWFIKYLLVNCIGEEHVSVLDKFLQFLSMLFSETDKNYFHFQKVVFQHFKFLL